MILHAGLLALREAGRWRGVLISGPSGVGKSDLALRLIEAGFRLVADDRVLLWRSGEALFGRAPDSLSGLIEARGLGVLSEPALPFAQVVLSCACVEGGQVARTPEPQVETHLGVRLPRVELAPLEASAPAKLRRALICLGTGR